MASINKKLKYDCGVGLSIVLSFIPPNLLKPTEEYNVSRADLLKEKIMADMIWCQPLLVERSRLLIMDGHHRYIVAKTMGLSAIPCFLLTYDNPYLKVLSRRRENTINIHDIINAGLTGNLLQYKSTNHQLLVQLPDVTVPLELLLPNVL